MISARFAAVVGHRDALNLFGFQTALAVHICPYKPWNWVDADPFQYEITQKRTFILLAMDAETIERATGVHVLPHGWAIHSEGGIH